MTPSNKWRARMDYNITAARILNADHLEELFQLTKSALDERGVECDLESLDLAIDWFTNEQPNAGVVEILEAFGAAANSIHSTH